MLSLEIKALSEGEFVFLLLLLLFGFRGFFCLFFGGFFGHAARHVGS